MDINSLTIGHWHEGALIHTSHCPYPDAKKGDVVETLNSRYLLGEPWQ